MAKTSSGPPPIVFILIVLLLLGGGYWWFVMRSKPTQPGAINPSPGGQVTPQQPGQSAPASGTFPLPTSVQAGTTVRIDGSTSMVTINQNLKRGFETQFPGTTVTAQARGSEVGLQAVLGGQADIAAVSRPLTPAEQGQGLMAQPIATDQIAVVVGQNNPFSGSLSLAQVAGIFQGQINNWSAVGGASVPIRVINRPPVSGTHQAFKELALNGGNFGTTPNIITLPRDETTGLLRELNTDGIGYATYAQVVNQQTVRSVPIDGAAPGTPNYPLQRQLYYVYKNPANPAVQAFVGYTTSPQGQQAMFIGN
ncbi:MAG: phosphate ABC transporter substrate-binding protein [Coleofasciculus sp. G3-WIS-01]|uniref:phosphate ABC transporter substrate-binding protein n=1 Tax=Coleofasciculus sp. G3-WIS-01 TaxID=3069528 RepID=UPI0033054FC0